MRLRVLFILAMFLLFSNASFARTDCQALKVRNIQVEAGKVLFSLDNGVWKTLGPLDAPGTKERYAALLAAQMAGRLVMIAFSEDGYDCNATDYGTPVFIVRTY